MTFEQMKIFLEAAHFGSFTQAAERLGLTQSAVSVSIKKLEEKHDIVLFDRSGRRLVLTEAGQVLLNEAERILRDLELTIRRVESHRPVRRKWLIACTPTAYDFWMPELVTGHRPSAATELELVRGAVDEVPAWVMRGTADFGVTSAMASHPQFNQVLVLSDRIILCGRQDRAREVAENSNWADLAEQGPIIWDQEELTAPVLAALASHRLNPQHLARHAPQFSSTSAVISALRSGRVIGFVPERAVAPLLAAKLLVRIGRFEIPLRYWLFAPREREMGGLAALIARTAASPAEK